MTEQERALIALATTLDELRIPYMVIGGIALAFWGEPRATLDIDVTVWIDDADLAHRVIELTARLPARVRDPEAFAREHRVLPVTSLGAGATPVDIILGLLPYEREAIERAVTRHVGDAPVRVASVEDLVLHKIISDRDRDVTDARALVRRHVRVLDRAYVEPRIQELADALERPDIFDRWSRWIADADV